MQVLIRTPKRLEVVEVGSVHHQGVPFPMSARITNPFANMRREMRSLVDGDAAHLVNHLDIDAHESGRLDNLIVVVISTRHHGRGIAERKAALHQRPVFRSIGRPELAAIFRLAPWLLATAPPRFRHLLQLLLPFSGQWRYAAIGWVYHD